MKKDLVLLVADNAVEQAIGLEADKGLREWLRERGFSFQPNEKPERPKEALEEALRVPQLPRSSALY